MFFKKIAYDNLVSRKLFTRGSLRDKFSTDLVFLEASFYFFFYGKFRRTHQTEINFCREKNYLYGHRRAA